MKVAFILTTLIASVSAFAPTSSSTQRTTTSIAAASFESELGAQKPLGFWDPLNFVYDVDQERFDRLRYVEIKHGRIAMLAVLGHIATTAGLRLPGNEELPTGIKALTSVPMESLLINIGIVGVFEVLIAKDAKGVAEYPGDLRNGLFKWSASASEQLEKRAIELNNGRAAQMGILGLMFHEQMTGEPYVLNAFLGYPTV